MPPSRSKRKKDLPLEANLLLTVALCLLAAGAVMVYSASSARTLLEGHSDDGTTFLVRYLVIGSIGLAVLHLMARNGVAYALRFTTPLLGVAFALLLLVKVPGIGVEINGARRWIVAGPIQFQPSEVAKLAVVLYCARILAEKPKVVREPRLLVPLGLVVGTVLLLVVSQPDLGTALVVAFTVAAMLVAAGMPIRHLVTIGAVGAGLVLLLALIEPYRRDRLMTFLDPWAHAGDEGFQSVQGQIAIGSGGFFGRGLGESVQKVFYLPEAHTDFILAIIGEELGILGITVLLALYGLIAYCGLRIAKAAASPYAKLLATGVTSLIVLQASLNVWTVLGIAPLTGVPLPFISYGMTNLVVLLAGIGLLLDVASGSPAHLKAVKPPRATGSRRDDARADRSRGNGGARGAGHRGGRRAAG